jgi:hypothetical protein
MKIGPLGAELFHAAGRADEQTDMTKLIVAFRNFAKAPQMFRLTGSIVDSKETQQKTRAHSGNSCSTGGYHKKIVPSTGTANVRVCTISTVCNKTAAFAYI